MKIAVAGKGGVGKTTLSSLIALYFSKSGKKVLAVDADPDSNLALTLGVNADEKITPISEMKDLIVERTGSSGGSGSFFKLNPKVDDIPEKFSKNIDGIKLIVMGTVRKGGGGCVCPENVLLKSLLHHLIVQRDEVVIVDMEAGIEHLGRGTAEAVDSFVIVVEPTVQSIQTAERIKNLAYELKVPDVFIVGNKIRNEEEVDFIKSRTNVKFAGYLSYDEEIRRGAVTSVSEKKEKEIVSILSNMKKNK